MKVKLLVSRAGAGFAQSVGDEIEVGEAEGGRMIAAGQAVPVRSEPVERAVVAAPETAARGRKRK